MWITNLATAETIRQIGRWLEDEKPSIAGRQGFSLAVLFRWLCDVWEDSRPTGWPYMNNGSRTSSIDSSTGGCRAGQRGSCWPPCSLLPSSLASRSNLITLWPDSASLMSSVLFTLCIEELTFSVVMWTDLSVCTHPAAVFVYHLAGVRQQSDRWYTLNFQKYTYSCSSLLMCQ